MHVFKQEVDRDYSGSVENVVIPSEWVKAAIDLDYKSNPVPKNESERKKSWFYSLRQRGSARIARGLFYTQQEMD